MVSGINNTCTMIKIQFIMVNVFIEPKL